MIIGCVILLNSAFSGFWEFFQKPPSGLHIAARRLMLY